MLVVRPAACDLFEIPEIDAYNHVYTGSDATAKDLEALVCNGETLQSFLPGRNITRVHWEPGNRTDLFTRTQEFADSLAAELSNLRALSLGGYWGRADLQLIGQHLKALQFLELIGQYQEKVSHIPILRVLI